MPNSFVDSLNLLDSTSVTRAGSLFFFSQVSDAPRLMSGDVLQSHLGTELKTQVYLTATQTLQASSTHIIDYGSAFFDPLGLFDVNSTGAIFINFTGFVNVRYSVRVGAVITAEWRSYVYKNGSSFIGNGLLQFDDDWNPTDTTMTAPFSVTSGDVLTVRAFSNVGNSLTAIDGYNFMEVTPLSIVAWS